MEQDSNSRGKTIVKYNTAGILMNLFLTIVKLIIGVRIHSHAVILDAVNGMSDMLSAALSILSSALGNMSANKKHPMGYGRVEYLFAMLITGIIMFVGVRSVISAIDAILHPHDPPNYDTTIIVIMALSVLLKVSYGLIMRIKGKEIHSIAMIMTGTESMGDALISIGILAAIAVYRGIGVDIEHYVCIGISLMILYTGWKMLQESLIKVLGERMDDEYEAKIRTLLIMEDGVLNVNNLVIHNYGEGLHIGSVDIEVDENMSALDITKLSRKLIRRAKAEGLTLTSVGISGTNISDPEASEIWDTIVEIARKHESILRVHSFTVDFDEKIISFYLVPDYSKKDRKDSIQAFRDELSPLFPGMSIEIFEAIDI